MSHNLSPVPVWTLPITVPDPGDALDASTVNTPFSAISNQSQLVSQSLFGGHNNTGFVTSHLRVSGSFYAQTGSIPTAGGAPVTASIWVDMAAFPVASMTVLSGSGGGEVNVFSTGEIELLSTDNVHEAGLVLEPNGNTEFDVANLTVNIIGAGAIDLNGNGCSLDLTAAGNVATTGTAITSNGIQCGGRAAVAITSTSQELTTGQMACHVIQFTGTLSGNTTVDFPLASTPGGVDGAHYIIDTKQLTFSGHSLTLTVNSNAAGGAVVYHSGTVQVVWIAFPDDVVYGAGN